MRFIKNSWTFIFLFLSLCVQSQSLSQGKAYLESGDLDKAEKVFLQLKNQPATRMQAFEFLGDIASQRENWDKAVEIYGDLLSAQPENANYNFKYGGALGMKALDLPKIQAAFYISDIKKYLHRAAELDLQHIEARWALLKLYLELPGILGGSEEVSLKYAEELYHISKVDGYLAKGFIAKKSKRFSEAERNYKAAVATGGSPHTYEELADFYLKYKEEPSAAILVYAKAFLKHKKHEYLGSIKEIATKYPDARKAGRKFINHYLLENNDNKEAFQIKEVLKE